MLSLSANAEPMHWFRRSPAHTKSSSDGAIFALSHTVVKQRRNILLSAFSHELSPKYESSDI